MIIVARLSSFFLLHTQLDCFRSLSLAWEPGDPAWEMLSSVCVQPLSVCWKTVPGRQPVFERLFLLKVCVCVCVLVIADFCVKILCVTNPLAVPLCVWVCYCVHRKCVCSMCVCGFYVCWRQLMTAHKSVLMWPGTFYIVFCFSALSIRILIVITRKLWHLHVCPWMCVCVFWCWNQSKLSSPLLPISSPTISFPSPLLLSFSLSSVCTTSSALAFSCCVYSLRSHLHTPPLSVSLPSFSFDHRVSHSV